MAESVGFEYSVDLVIISFVESDALGYILGIFVLRRVERRCPCKKRKKLLEKARKNPERPSGS